jgi:hypothetical protein
MKKKKESESFYQEQYHRLVADNNNMINLSLGLAVVAFAGIVGTILLAISGDELTKKVRRYARNEEIEYNERVFKDACARIEGTTFYGVCYKNNAKLRSIDEIKQAALHFDLGDKK